MFLNTDRKKLLPYLIISFIICVVISLSISLFLGMIMLIIFIPAVWNIIFTFFVFDLIKFVTLKKYIKEKIIWVLFAIFNWVFVFAILEYFSTKDNSVGIKLIIYIVIFIIETILFIRLIYKIIKDIINVIKNKLNDCPTASNK
jgi:hypothetical protein